VFDSILTQLIHFFVDDSWVKRCSAALVCLAKAANPAVIVEALLKYISFAFRSIAYNLFWKFIPLIYVM